MQVKRTVRKGAELTLCHIQKLPVESSNSSGAIHAEVSHLISKYPGVFPTALQEPNSLRTYMPTVITTDPAAKIPNQPMFR